jgi:hypothetical protein
MTSAPSRAVQAGDLVTAEEIAAVVAALNAAVHGSLTSSDADPSGYVRWRHTRLKALRAR